MKRGKVFERLVGHSKVEKIVFYDTVAYVYLKEGLYNGLDNYKVVTTAHQANQFIKGASHVPCRPGYKLMKNLFTLQLVEVPTNTTNHS